MECSTRKTQRVPVTQYVSCESPSCSSCQRNRTLKRSRVLKELEVKEKGSGELAGLVTLLVCVVYTIVTFLLAFIIGRVAPKIFPSDGKINCKLDYHEELKLKKADSNNNFVSEMSKRLRTLSHG